MQGVIIAQLYEYKSLFNKFSGALKIRKDLNQNMDKSPTPLSAACIRWNHGKVDTYILLGVTKEIREMTKRS